MKTYLEILDTIKAECRVSSSNDLDDWIKDVINQELRTLCANAEYPELLVPFATLQVTSGAQSVYSLPVGARNIQSVEWNSQKDSDSWWSLTPRNSFINSLSAGSPKWFFKAGNSLYVFPYSSVTTDGALRISYYKTVAALSLDTDMIEVPDLEEPLIARVVARVMRYHKDSASSQASGADAVGAEVRVVQ